MAKLKFETREATIADLVSMAYGELASLAEEAREIADNATDGLRETQRIQTLEETADALENLSEPDVPAAVASLRAEYREWSNARRGRGLSRADRCAWAVSVLDTVVDVLGEGLSDEIDELRDQLESDKGDAEGCEFPGMYG